MDRNRRFLIGIGIAVLLAVGAVYSLVSRRTKAVTEETVTTQPTLEEATTAYKQLAEEMLPGVAIPEEGDVKGMQKLVESKTGFKLSEVSKNPDGTYSVVFSGGTDSKPVSGSLLSKEEQEEYRREFIESRNAGKNVQLTDRDRRAIAEFRKKISRSKK